MATQPINFKRVGTPSYRTYRVLQARGDWGQIYRERVALYGDLHGAIIFPEQLFTLNQAAIFGATASQTPSGPGHSGTVGGMSLTVQRFESIGIYDGVNQRQLTHSQQVLDYEEANYDKEGVRRLYLGTDFHRSNMPVFGHVSALFTNKDSAVRFLEREVRQNLRKLIP